MRKFLLAIVVMMSINCFAETQINTPESTNKIEQFIAKAQQPPTLESGLMQDFGNSYLSEQYLLSHQQNIGKINEYCSYYISNNEHEKYNCEQVLKTSNYWHKLNIVSGLIFNNILSFRWCALIMLCFLMILIVIFISTAGRVKHIAKSINVFFDELNRSRAK